MKKFFVYVLVCFLLCNSVLADFENMVSEPVEAASSEPVEVEVIPDENQLPLEKVDTIVSSVPDLVNSATSEISSGESYAEVSPGGNTVYVLTNPVKESGTDVGAYPFDPLLTNVAVTTGLSPVTPNDATGLKAVLLSFIGNYDPPVVQFEYTTSNNYKQFVNEIQPDYVWICSFALIALFIYCLFKLGGALIRV